METSASDGFSEVRNEKDKFQVILNVSHFNPNEVEVKVVDNFVVIHGIHEEKTDEHGVIQREFNRRYMLPEVMLKTLKLLGVLMEFSLLKLQRKQLKLHPMNV